MNRRNPRPTTKSPKPSVPPKKKLTMPDEWVQGDRFRWRGAAVTQQDAQQGDGPDIRQHVHEFPNGNNHRHAHALTEDHPAPVNEAHPQPYYFLCDQCEPDRARIARERARRRVDEEFR